jgi:hypothetical protein
MIGDGFDARLEVILDALPDGAPGGGNRRHALTKHDMRLIFDAIRISTENQTCSLRFTTEDAQDFLRMKHERRHVLTLMGAVVVGVLVWVATKTLDLMDLHPTQWFHR